MTDSPKAPMQIGIVPVTPLQQNCSLIWCTKTMRGAFVDPGGDLDRLRAALDKTGVTLEKVLPAAEQEATLDKAVWHRDQTDEAQLKKLLQDHNRWTGSKRARELLDNWSEARAKFVKVFPNEYKRALGEINAKKAVAAATSKAKGSAKKQASPAE